MDSTDDRDGAGRSPRPPPSVHPLAPGEWAPLVDPVRICSLPFEADGIPVHLRIEFRQEIEDGVGRVLLAPCTVDDRPVLLIARPDAPEGERLVELHVLPDDLEWRRARAAVCAAFGVAVADLPDDGAGLPDPPWTLLRLDDNGNEIEMRDYLLESRAEAARRIYEARGHKQTYSIRPRRR